MSRAWDPAAPGILRLPSGRLLRGRGLRQPLLDDLAPHFAVYLRGKRPAPVAWDARWVRWPDFQLPTDRRDAQDALREAWHGRTGTALGLHRGAGRCAEP